MPKYLLRFEKGDSVRWLGHLDILRTFERAIRRAELPIAFSQGFNPREKIAFASALSVGVTGGDELATLELTSPLLPERIQAQLNTALPEGIRIRRCQEIDDAEAKAIVSQFDRAEYEVSCRLPAEAATSDEAINEAIEAALAQSELCILREREGRTKQINIRPNLYALALLPESRTEDRLTLRMRVGQGESGTARPAEVVQALQPWLPGLALRRAHRVCLIQKEAASPAPTV